MIEQINRMRRIAELKALADKAHLRGLPDICDEVTADLDAELKAQDAWLISQNINPTNYRSAVL